MSTLISAGNSDGVYGRCDAKCYGAQHPKCDCICGGRNHGVGLRQALTNTSEQFRPMLEEYVAAHPDHTLEFAARRRSPGQRDLFVESPA